MDKRITEAFKDVWRLYDRYYETDPADAARWDSLVKAAEEINNQYKDLPVVFNFLLVIMGDIDRRAKTA